MSLKLKIPPPVQGLFWAAFMWFIAQNLPHWRVDFAAQKPLGLILIAAGILIELISVGEFFRKRTTINPLKPENTSRLVVEGLYKFSRNPMYLGMLALLLGWAILLGHPLNMIGLAAFVAGMNALQIKPEEEHLSRKFGQDFEAYKARVRRWI